MNEQGEMYGRSPGQDVPGHRTFAQITLNPWHDAVQHREEAADRNRGLAIERKRASPLTDHLSGPWLTRIDARRMGTRVNHVRHGRTVVSQFNDPPFSARFPRCDFHLVED